MDDYVHQVLKDKGECIHDLFQSITLTFHLGIEENKIFNLVP